LLDVIGRVPFEGTKRQFKQKLKNFITELLDNYDREDKDELMRLKRMISSKLKDAIKIPLENVLLYNSAMEYVKRQPKEYQDNYIHSFFIECTTSYDTGPDRSSCIGGIRERIILMLANAVTTRHHVFEDNEEYKRVSGIIYPSLVIYTKRQLYHFISMCVDNPPEQGGISHLLESAELTIQGKKDLIIECVLSKLDHVHEQTMRNLNNIMDNEMDRVLSGGGRRKRTTRKHKRRACKTKRRACKRRACKTKRRACKRRACKTKRRPCKTKRRVFKTKKRMFKTRTRNRTRHRK